MQSVVRACLELVDMAGGMLDGRPLREYPLAVLRQNIGFVPQETFLFSETVRENIAFGEESARDEDVRAAADAANIATDIEDMITVVEQFRSDMEARYRLIKARKAPAGDAVSMSMNLGYAVSSFRRVSPALGTTEQLAALAREFQEHGISLVLDFVFGFLFEVGSPVAAGVTMFTRTSVV